jgi:acetyl esterase/lipase
MNAPARTALMDVTTQDLEYQRIGGKPLLARLYRPQGHGPFPAVVGVHGGAWTNGDATTTRPSIRRWPRSASWCSRWTCDWRRKRPLRHRWPM